MIIKLMSTPNKSRLIGFAFACFVGEKGMGVDLVNFLYSWSSTDSNLTSPFFIYYSKERKWETK